MVQMFCLDLISLMILEWNIPVNIKKGNQLQLTREFQKKKSASLTTLKSLTVWITTNCRKFLKWWEYQTTLTASWETCIQVKKQQLELDMEQWTGSKLGKEYGKAEYCHPDYLTSVQSTSCKMLDCMKHKLESRLQGEISTTSDMQMIPLWWQKVKSNWKASRWRWKRRVKKLA